jgi:hypothetical protein
MNRSVIRLFFDCFNRADKRYSLIWEKGCLGSIPFLIYYAIALHGFVGLKPAKTRTMVVIKDLKWSDIKSG